MDSFKTKIVLILITCFRQASFQELYVGCYQNFSGSPYKKDPIQSVFQCLTECRSQTSLFAAVKDGSSCYCGNITNTRVPSSNCNLPCGDNSGTCGGINLYAVYTGIPTYLGCFKDGQPRDMDFIYNKYFMTIEKCYEKCSISYNFMGIQFAGTCFCDQQYGKYGRAPESECFMKCEGNSTQICGGSYRNNIYSAGLLPGLNKSYNEVFHCYYGEPDMHGTCNGCQTGWKGTKCNQRICTTNNGKCGEHKCEEIKIGNQIISECVCKEGFQSISIYDECTDINECSNTVCNNETSTCNNTIGSYGCICNDGFVMGSSNAVCVDFDECQSNPCNEPSETCINTFGSFMCTCSPGYNYIYLSNCTVYCNNNLYKCENSCNKFLNYACSNDETKYDAGKIVGGVLGAIAVLFLLAAIVIFGYCLYVKRNKVNTNDKRTTDLKTFFQGNSRPEIKKMAISEVGEYFNNHKNNINEDFQKCQKEFGHPQIVASLHENASKNRFKKIFPYDYNRVNLSNKPDYINASFIQTYGKPSNTMFVAAQGPKLETTEDFWKMIWDNNVQIIVMLINCHENEKEKCCQYWSDEGNLKLGNFIIQNIEKEERLNHFKRTFKVVRNNKERMVCHFLYVAWKDKEVPGNIFSLVNLREKVISIAQQKSQNNIVVHCSDGVGRTGTFIALDYLVRQAEQEGCVDFYECLKFLRNQRSYMIQTSTQYELCFRAIAMFHMIGKSTFISTDDSNACKNKMQELTDELLQKQFDSSRKASSYMIGVIPSAFVVEDLFNLFDGNDDIVIILDRQELTFLPKDQHQLRLKNGFIQLSETMETDFYMKHFFKIGKEVRVTYENTCLHHPYVNEIPHSALLHVSKNVITSFETIIRLYAVVKPILGLEDKRVILLSRNGYKDAGFLIAAFNIMQTIDISKEVDVYETVFELRNIQPEIINNIDLYKNLYSFAKQCLNRTRSILNTGLKTMMQCKVENKD